MTGERGTHHSGGQGFPDDQENWEPGDYEGFYGGPEDEDLERLPSYLEEDLESYEVAPEKYLDGLVERRTHGWRFDNTGYYAYILFDGNAALRDDVVGKLKAKGIISLARGRSHKPADNNRQYDWYLRVAELTDGKLRHPRRHIVASVFRQLPLYEPDESEENLEFLRRIEQLEDKFELERRFSDRLYKQLAEAQESTIELLQRVELSTSEIRGLREERQNLASRLTRQDHETGESREKAEQLANLLSEKARELEAKEEELDALFSEAGRVEERANHDRAELRETEERLAAAELEIEDLRQRPEQEPDSSRKSSRRDEDTIGEVIEQLLPNLRVLNRRSVSTLLKEINSPAGALRLLQRLDSNPGSFRSRLFRSAPCGERSITAPV